MHWMLLLAGFAIASLTFVIWATKRRRTKIPALQKERLRSAWDAALELKSPAQRVLDAEKVCDAVLKALDYQGTFAEKQKQAAPRLHHAEELWIAHRLRNSIAHDVGIRVTEAQSLRALQAFAQIVHQFLS